MIDCPAVLQASSLRRLPLRPGWSGRRILAKRGKQCEAAAVAGGALYLHAPSQDVQSFAHTQQTESSPGISCRRKPRRVEPNAMIRDRHPEAAEDYSSVFTIREDGIVAERYTRSVAFWKSAALASLIFMNFWGLRSVSGNHVLWT